MLDRFRRLVPYALTLALAGPALAQAPATPPGSPPGGVTSAWPLGMIVLLVGFVALWGFVLARRRAGARGAAPRPR